MTHRFGTVRRFRFNRPQQIAAGLLALFLLQGLWITSRQTLSYQDYQYACCGRETWEKPSPPAGYYTPCGHIPDGILAYRLAGLPLALNLLAGRALGHFRKPEDRVVRTGVPADRSSSAGWKTGSELSTWELRQQMTRILLLVRLPFLGAGFLLGGALWWVTRRLYGNLGGYTALAFYCFSPAILRACVHPGADILAALGVYGGIYTCIGVAHAMQGPRRKWRPRIVLLTAIFGIAAAAHIAALPAAALLGLGLMLWIAEGRRSLIFPILLAVSAGALLLVFLCYGFSPDAFRSVFRSGEAFVRFSLDPARRFFSTFAEAGIAIAAVAAALLYLASHRTRYFGNTAPLLCTLALMPLVMTGTPGAPWLWAIPFLLTFIGGVFADAYESARPRLALGAAGAIVGLQVILSVLNLAGRG